MNMKLSPTHPGEILREELLLPMGISIYFLAKEIGIPQKHIDEIVAGRSSITADTDLRLCQFFGLSEGYWMRAQVRFDTEIAKDAMAYGKPWPSKA